MAFGDWAPPPIHITPIHMTPMRFTPARVTPRPVVVRQRSSGGGGKPPHRVKRRKQKPMSKKRKRQLQKQWAKQQKQLQKQLKEQQSKEIKQLRKQQIKRNKQLQKQWAKQQKQLQKQLRKPQPKQRKQSKKQYKSKQQSGISIIPARGISTSVLQKKSIETLTEILRQASQNHNVIITSVQRNSKSQAAAMLDNLKKYSIKKERHLYRKSPEALQVIAVFEDLLRKGKPTDEELIDAMAAIIDSFPDPSKVSHHIFSKNNPLDVIDISPASITNPALFKKALENAKSRKLIAHYISPHQGEPVWHIEIRRRKN